MATTPNEQGALARLNEALRATSGDHAKALRELAQKECEADLKANDALLVRGNQLLAATGVALTLLIGASKAIGTGSCWKAFLLITGLVAAGVAVICVALCLLVRGGFTRMEDEAIAGTHITETDPKLRQRDHELSLAVAYMDIRMELDKRHALRARWLLAAQCCYLVFVVAMVMLGITVAV